MSDEIVLLFESTRTARSVELIEFSRGFILFICSWEDYILEGILAGENNPFVEAAANVGNPKSAWSGGVPPSLQAAAAADLDSLQRLSITESTLSGWVYFYFPNL